MKAGKLKESVLKRSILKQLHKKSKKLLCGPQVGGDYGAIQVKEDLAVVLSSEPITLAREDIGSAAIMAACNNVACSGGRLQGISAVMLLPTSYNEEELRGLMKDMNQACKACGVEIINGHTEVIRGIEKPIVMVTAMGTVEPSKMLSKTGLKPGMDIIATKWIGLQGTARLAKEREGELLSRYTAPFIDGAKIFSQMMSIIPEAAVAVQSGACAMHDVSEGGIFAALWEMAESAGVGLEIDLKKIPIRQETVEICEFFDENPYKILSGGCLLIGAADGNSVVLELEKAGIPAVVIGKATDSNDRVLINEEERRFLERN